MKSVAWNYTDAEFDRFYDLNDNFENLLNYYMSASGLKNKFLTNKSHKAVYRCQMKEFYDAGDLKKPRMKKMIAWLKEDHETKLRKRDLQNHDEQGKIMDMKDKENDRLNRELQEARLLIADLQRLNNRQKIKVKELELTCEKLSLIKTKEENERPIVEYGCDQDSDPYSTQIATQGPVDDSDDDIF